VKFQTFNRIASISPFFPVRFLSPNPLIRILGHNGCASASWICRSKAPKGPHCRRGKSQSLSKSFPTSGPSPSNAHTVRMHTCSLTRMYTLAHAHVRTVRLCVSVRVRLSRHLSGPSLSAFPLLFLTSALSPVTTAMISACPSSLMSSSSVKKRNRATKVLKHSAFVWSSSSLSPPSTALVHSA
jgi:hypothetical protein